MTDELLANGQLNKWHMNCWQMDNWTSERWTGGKLNNWKSDLCTDGNRTTEQVTYCMNWWQLDNWTNDIWTGGIQSTEQMTVELVANGQLNKWQMSWWQTDNWTSDRWRGGNGQLNKWAGGKRITEQVSDEEGATDNSIIELVANGQLNKWQMSWYQTGHLNN